MELDTELHRRPGCRFSLQKLQVDPVANVAEAVGFEHRALRNTTASSFDLISTPPLNTGYLYNDKGYLGAYSITELDESYLTTQAHGLDERWNAVECPEHQWYGTQFHPVKFGRRICKFGPQQQFSPMVHFAFNAVTDGVGSGETATVEEIVSSARELFVDTEEYAEQLHQYLLVLAENDTPGPFDPLVPTDGDEKRLQSP